MDLNLSWLYQASVVFERRDARELSFLKLSLKKKKKSLKCHVTLPLSLELAREAMRSPVSSSHLSWTSSSEYYCLSLSKDTWTEVSVNLTWLMDTFKGSVTGSESTSRSVVSDSLQPHELYSPWNSPGQNPGVGSCFLLQGIFPAQRSNPGFLHCRWILY